VCITEADCAEKYGSDAALAGAIKRRNRQIIKTKKLRPTEMGQSLLAH
jgi:hypothetical protein